MKKIVLYCLCICLALVVASACFAAEEIKIGAGAAPSENILKPIKAAFESATGIKLTIISSGPKIAMVDLEKGGVDAAAAGLSYSDLTDLLKKENVELKEPAIYKNIVIGKDKIAVLLNKENPIAALSKEQLKGIFTGRIANWKEVGGADMPVIIIWGKLIQGTNSFFTKATLDGEPVAKDVLDATTADDIKQNIVANKEAVGIGPSAIVDATVNAPAIPDISRPIILVTKGAPSANVQKLIEFIAAAQKAGTLK